MSNEMVPAGKVVRLKLGIRRGDHNDPSQGWTDGYATKASTGSIYLNVEYHLFLSFSDLLTTIDMSKTIRKTALAVYTTILIYQSG